MNNNDVRAPEGSDIQFDHLLDKEWEDEYRKKKKERKTRWQIISLQVVLGIFFINLVLAIVRSNHQWLESHMPQRFIIFSLIIATLFALLSSFFLGYWKHAQASRMFSPKYEHLWLSVPIGIVSNYYVMGSHKTKLEGATLSDVFDIFYVVALACIIGVMAWTVVREENALKSEKRLWFDKRSAQSHALINSDRPIQSLEEDLFNRAGMAKQLVEIIGRQGEESLTIGLYGEWGTGKSSLFEMMKDLKKEEDQVHYFEFKPWYFGVDNHEIIRKFLLQFIEEIKIIVGGNAELEKKLRKYAQLLSGISLRPPGAILAMDKLLEKVLFDENNVSLTELKKSIESAMKLLPKKIVVLMDDIDRLEPQEIQVVFKLVRLVADFPNVTYLLALDERVVVEVLDRMFTGHDAKTQNLDVGRKYLEKFIQVPIYLPTVDPAVITKMCLDGIELVSTRYELNANIPFALTWESIQLEFGLAFRKLNFTPRNVKRYLNTIEVMLPLLKNYVNIEDFLYLQLINVGAPGLYEMIRKNRQYFLQKHENINEKYRDEVRGYLVFREIVERLFPYSAQLFEQQSIKLLSEKKIQKAEKEGRILSATFFDKYFMYNVPLEQISQQALEALKDKLKAANGPLDALDMYNELSDVFGVEKVNLRIRNSTLMDDLKFLECIVDAIVMKYGQIYDFNNQYKELQNCLMFLNDCIIRIGIDSLKKTQLFRSGAHLMLLLNLHDWWDKEEPFIDELKNLLRIKLKAAETNFIDKFSKQDSSRLLDFWRKIDRESSYRNVLIDWIPDVRHFEKLLESIFYETGNRWNDNPIIKLEAYTRVVTLVPSDHLEKLIVMYNGENRLTYVSAFKQSWDTVIQELTPIVEGMRGDPSLKLPAIVPTCMNQLIQYEASTKRLEKWKYLQSILLNHK